MEKSKLQALKYQKKILGHGVLKFGTWKKFEIATNIPSSTLIRWYKGQHEAKLSILIFISDILKMKKKEHL